MESFRAVFLLVVVVVAAVGVMPAHGGISAAACRAERRAGVNACKAVLYGELPSPQCCERVRVTHVECVCPVITPKLAALVDVNRFVGLVEGCGRRVPHHYKCGTANSGLLLGILIPSASQVWWMAI